MIDYKKRAVEVGKRIKNEREKCGWSRKKFLPKIFMSENSFKAIQSWENGDRLPDLTSLARMAELFKCDIGYLLGDYPERTRDEADASIITGLSGETIRILQQINEWKHGILGCSAKGYTIGELQILDCLIQSNKFHALMGDIGFYLIFGGILPNEAYQSEVKDISNEELEKFRAWANDRGLETLPRKDVCEMYLQKACDDLKDIFKDVLSTEKEKGAERD